MYIEVFCVIGIIKLICILNIDKYIDCRLINLFIWKLFILFVDCVLNYWCIVVLRLFYIF